MAEPSKKLEIFPPTDPKEVMGALTQAEELRRTQEHLDDLLIEGLESGAGIPVTREYWEQKREGLKARLAAKKSAKR